jgi:oligopeptide/dipeptide ABC transporter ATP-binding protein
MTDVLEIRDLEVVYDRQSGPPVRAVVDASLTVGRGEIVGLVGESGCGKSTLARAAVGLVPHTAGAVVFEGRSLQPLSRRARPKADTRLQMVFQDPHASLNPRRKVGTQVADALASLGRRSRRARAARVAELLDEVGLPPDAGERFPHEFSGGQRQRIAIARALAAEPTALVLDEPLSSLDASAQAQIANLLVRLTRELELGLLLISHDLAVVRQVADRVCVMYLGEVVEQASTAALWAEPLHPYTEALIAAIPHADGSGFLPEALAGEVPDPVHPPSGCRFHPRCPIAVPHCAEEAPPFESVAEGRDVACWLRGPRAAELLEAGQAERLA